MVISLPPTPPPSIIKMTVIMQSKVIVLACSPHTRGTEIHQLNQPKTCRHFCIAFHSASPVVTASSVFPFTFSHSPSPPLASCLPYVPEQGTVGASGDLAPLSHLALGLMGEGQMWSPETGWDNAKQVCVQQKGL